MAIKRTDRLVKELAQALVIELNNCEGKDPSAKDSGNHQVAWKLVEEAGLPVPEGKVF